VYVPDHAHRIAKSIVFFRTNSFGIEDKVTKFGTLETLWLWVPKVKSHRRSVAALPCQGEQDCSFVKTRTGSLIFWQPEKMSLLNIINVKNCSLSTTYNGEMTHRKQQK